MKPMFLPEIEAHRSDELESERIRSMERAGIPVPQILHLFAYKPDRTRHLARFTQGVMRGPSPLAPGIRELIAAFVSSRNQCPFWLGAHAAVAAELLGDGELVAAVMRDHRSAPLDDKHRALFDLIHKVNAASNTIGPGDLSAAKQAGWSEEALYDAITVAALFRFYNTWIDATGVGDMTPEAYAQSGQRMATQGYVHFPEE